MGSHGWDETSQKAEDASSGGKFLKLENDKDKALLVFIGDPFSREVFWTGEGYVDADTDEGRVYADNHATKKPAFRASINCFVLDHQTDGDADFVFGDAKKWPGMQIFENGVNWYKDLVKSKKKYGLGITVFELQRQGKANDTKTKYSILPDRGIDKVPGLKEAIAKATLHNLANPFEDDDEATPGTSTSSSNGIISEDDAAKLIVELKTLPRTDLTAFLTEFGIDRVKALSSAKLSDAINWVAVKKSPAAESGEVDPFA